jgi:hypothetical protein
MRRILALLAAVSAGAALAAPISFAAASTPPGAKTPGAGAVEERYGLVRYDTKARRWAILSTPPFQNRGLTGVSCASKTGILTVSFAPLTSIGTFTVDEDDLYAGRYAAGAVATSRSLAITFRKVKTGAVVSCGAAELRIAGSSLQLWVRGTRANTQPPTTSLPPPSTWPTPQPTTPSPPPPMPSTWPTTPPPTTSGPAASPPTIPPADADPEDQDPTDN